MPTSVRWPLQINGNPARGLPAGASREAREAREARADTASQK